MKVNKAPIAAPMIVVLGLSLGLGLASPVLATSSEKFSQRGVDVYDSFDIARTRSTGEDGFLQITDDGFDPIIGRESLGENIDVAWELGLTFADRYADPHQRAEKIFEFVRNKVVYTSDKDEFGRGEFAQNADEVAEAILENGAAPGDCEDSAILLAVMYKAAGYRSAIVLAPGHAAALVHLPGYKKTAHALTLEREEGWVWAEATGRSNPLSWFETSFVDDGMAARELSEEAIPKKELTYGLTAVRQASSGGGFSLGGGSSFFGVIMVLWFLSSIFRRPARRRR